MFFCRVRRALVDNATVLLRIFSSKYIYAHSFDFPRNLRSSDGRESSFELIVIEIMFVPAPLNKKIDLRAVFCFFDNIDI